MGDEGAKTIKCPGWIGRSIELFSKHWATVLELRTAGKVVRSTPVKYNRDSSKETPYRYSSFVLP